MFSNHYRFCLDMPILTRVDIVKAVSDDIRGSHAAVESETAQHSSTEHNGQRTSLGWLQVQAVRDTGRLNEGPVAGTIDRVSCMLVDLILNPNPDGRRTW